MRSLRARRRSRRSSSSAAGSPPTPRSRSESGSRLALALGRFEHVEALLGRIDMIPAGRRPPFPRRAGGQVPCLPCCQAERARLGRAGLQDGRGRLPGARVDVPRRCDGSSSTASGSSDRVVPRRPTGYSRRRARSSSGSSRRPWLARCDAAGTRSCRDRQRLGSSHGMRRRRPRRRPGRLHGRDPRRAARARRPSASSRSPSSAARVCASAASRPRRGCRPRSR